MDSGHHRSSIKSVGYASPSLSGRRSPLLSGGPQSPNWSARRPMLGSIESSSMQSQQSFDYQDITIDKTKCLGQGSYGAVYQAKCNQLSCAAKVMHQALSSPEDPGAPLSLEKFRQECCLLSMTRHPNIVQYLTTSFDRETMQPVLLMELCEGNLTGLLERSPGPLPYHTQLNIAHDIALAVVYLHSNGLYHRDLSSNNILLDHGRAKVTDFGMSKLAGIQVQPGTLCPGNVLYMPPEALDEPPTYTDKLDIFSFGVLLVQVLIRKFPSPANRFTTTRVEACQQFPKGIAHIPVPETTRRQDHLRLIDNAHPLKAIALKCLSDSDKDRPTSSDLSLSLSSLKATPEYARSLREETEERRSRTQPQQLQGYTEELDRQHRDYEEELQRHLRSRDEQLEQAKVQLQNLVDTRNQVEQLKLQLQGQRKLTDFGNHKLEEKRKEIEKKNLELNDSQELVADFQKTLNEGEKVTKKERMEFQQSLKQKDMQIKELKDSVLLKDKKINDLEFTIKTLQTAPKGPGGMGEVEGGQHKDMTALQWEVAETAPVEMSAGSAVAIGEDIYVSPDSSKVVYCYNPLRKWSALPQCECVGFSLAAVENTLTTVGGRDDNFTNKLFSFVDHRDWQEKLPPMPTARTEPITLSTDRHLIAAGGFSGTRALDTIEVLTMADKQWTTCASSLPHRVSGGSMWLCDRQLYLAPRNVESVTTQQMVLTCPMDDLFKPLRKKSRFSKPSGPWERIANLPIPLASIVSLNGHILALGGKDTQNGPSYTSTRVYAFSPASGGPGAWKNVSGMTKGRWSSITAVLPGHRLIVVGGQSNWEKTNIVEIATL